MVIRPLEMEGGFKGGRTEVPRNLAAFWVLGVLNNSAYVIMLAGASSISASAVGAVYLAAVLPGLLLKASAPYWFHRVRYSTRVLAAASLMAASYTSVALAPGRPLQLAGVVLASLQGALGEASCLALTSRYNSQATITAWSSGTGFAGVAGYAWVASLHVAAGWSLRATLLAANFTVVAWLAAYFLLLEPPEQRERQLLALVQADEQLVGAAMGAMSNAGGDDDDSSGDERDRLLLLDPSLAGPSTAAEHLPGSWVGTSRPAQAAAPGRRQRSGRLHRAQRVPGRGGKAARMGMRERMQRTAALWPYTVPLMTVYFAEYAMQSGTWAAIGFPVTDAAARRRFYVYANWCYQTGVFLSRSSGLLWQAGRAALWAMPAAQVLFLAFFLADAAHHFWYNWGLLAPAFATGLLGGAVYVQAFSLISREVDPEFREFSLAAASVADSLGVALADVAGILIQGCLFKANGLAGADYAC